MILKESKDQKGKFFRAGLIERLALTLENYASSEWGNRFYGPEFLEGFCARRNEIHADLGKKSAALAMLTTLLAFFDSISGTTKLWGIEFSVPELGAMAFCVFVSINFLSVILAFLDQLTIDRFLSTLGSRIGAYSFELALLDKSAVNLWTLAIAPKYHGLISDTGHKFASGVLSLFFAVFGLLALSYPVAIVSFTILGRYEMGLDMISLLLSGIAIFIFLFSFAILVIFSATYKFRSSELPEPSGGFLPDNFVELGYPIREDTGSEDQA